MRKESQQKVKVKVVMQSQKRDLFLMGNLPSPAFTLFTEQEEVGRREAPSLAAMVAGCRCDWLPQLDQTEPCRKPDAEVDLAGDCVSETGLTALSLLNLYLQTF